MNLGPIIGCALMGYMASEFKNAKENVEKQKINNQKFIQLEKQRDELEKNLKQQEQQVIDLQKQYEQILKKIQPTNIDNPIQIIDYSPDYISVYDKQKKIPIAVEETITKERLEGNANRKYSQFYEEKQIEDIYQSKLKDYANTYQLLDLNRGHMSAASNHRYSQQAMNSSFSLANVVPQSGDNNQDLWLTFESLSKVEANQNDKIKVISGPIFQDEQIDIKNLEKPKRIGNFEFKRAQKSDKYIGQIQHKVIGDSKIFVPTHLYKIFYIQNENQKNQLGCFIVPNSNNDNIDLPLQNWQVPLEKIEKLTGLSFNELKLNQENNIDYCEQQNSNCLKTQREIDYQYYKQSVEQSNDIQTTAFVENMLRIKKQSITDYDDMFQFYKNQFGEVPHICKNISKKNPYWKPEKDCDQFDCFIKINKELGNTILKGEEDLVQKFVQASQKSMMKCNKTDPQKVKNFQESFQKSWWQKQTIFGTNYNKLFSEILEKKNNNV